MKEEIESFELLLKYPSLPVGIAVGDILHHKKGQGFYMETKDGIKIHFNILASHMKDEVHWRKVEKKKSKLKKIIQWLKLN